MDAFVCAHGQQENTFEYKKSNEMTLSLRDLETLDECNRKHPQTFH